MKRLIIAILCLLIINTTTAFAEESEQSSYTDYGSNLCISTDATIPQPITIEHKYTAEAYMASDEDIMSEYNVTATDTSENKNTEFIQHAFKGNDIEIYSSNDGGFFYQTDDYITYYTLLYYCVDSDDIMHPEWMLSNMEELDFMTKDDAATLIGNEMNAVLGDVTKDFSIQYDVYPAHAEDLRSKVSAILKEECQSDDDIAFYKRKYGIYEGCIDDDGCYFIEGHVSLDGLPMLSGSYSLSSRSVSGMRIRAIVNRNGLLYIEVSDVISIIDTESIEPMQLNCEELLTKAGDFLDNIIGIQPLSIDKVELIYVPYPTTLHEYELIPMLCLSAYDSENDTYTRQALINAFTGELLF